MSKVFCLFHPATGVPGSVFVAAEERESLVRRCVFITATAQAETGLAGLWPADLLRLLERFYGYAQVPRPRDVMSAVMVDIHLENAFPDRPDGVGPVEVLLADPDLSRDGLAQAVSENTR